MGATSTQEAAIDDIKKLDLLFEINTIMEQAEDDVQEALPEVVEAIARHTGMWRGALTLLNRDTGEIMIDAAFGLSAKQRERGRYRLGEGVTGRVVQNGRPILVPRLSQDPDFLDKTGSKKELEHQEQSYVCVPIKRGSEVMGTLSMWRNFTDEPSLDGDQRLLTIIASMIAQAVSLRRRIREEHDRLSEENQRLQQELADRFRPSNMIGNSQAMQSVYDMIRQVSGSNATVFIRGESGTGKELVAQAIHYNSPRATEPFIKVNCAALPETVLESELFGHEKGAFTGAVQTRKGRFELADGGTIFLDEVGDFSPATQIKLLRVLQEREFERVGSTQTIKVNVRIVAATNRNLEEMLETNDFRQDLFYRLNVFPIHLPPLRERRTDILLLANHFVEQYSRESGKAIRRISTPAIDMMMAYHWPGNVRELENCIERAVLVSDDGVIHGHHLPPTLQTAEASGTQFDGTLEATLENVERELLIDALKSARGNKAKAARQLGITERLMGLRVNKHGIDARRFRTSA